MSIIVDVLDVDDVVVVVIVVVAVDDAIGVVVGIVGFVVYCYHCGHNLSILCLRQVGFKDGERQGAAILSLEVVLGNKGHSCAN